MSSNAAWLEWKPPVTRGEPQGDRRVKHGQEYDTFHLFASEGPPPLLMLAASTYYNQYIILEAR